MKFPFTTVNGHDCGIFHGDFHVTRLFMCFLSFLSGMWWMSAPIAKLVNITRLTMVYRYDIYSRYIYTILRLLDGIYTSTNKTGGHHIFLGTPNDINDGTAMPIRFPYRRGVSSGTERLMARGVPWQGGP